MLHVDIPTLPEVKALVRVRADACVSIYLPTTPMSQESKGSRIELHNLGKVAIAQLEAVGLDKKRVTAIAEQLADLDDDEQFWNFQAHSLAVLVTPDSIRTFRLPNRLSAMAQVSDRFHLKPLLRVITFPHEAFVLALTENGVRLVEVFSDLPAAEIAIPGMPKSAADAVNRSTVNDRSPSGRLQGSEGQKVLLRQFARQVDAVLRPVLAGRDTPLILAATEPLASIYRSVSTYPALAAEGIVQSPGKTTDSHLADAARSILDQLHAGELAAAHQLHGARSSEGKTTNDITKAAHAATFGVIDTLLVDIDDVTAGTVDDATGAVSFAAEQSAKSYGVVDEIAGRALLSGARVLGVRKADIPGGGPLAAILRYTM